MLEAINAIAPIVTALIIAATAIAALIQLRHMRAANHISAMWSVHQTFSESGYRDALALMRRNLKASMSDPRFRQYVSDAVIGKAAEAADPAHAETQRAANMILNTYEVVGNMIVLGLIDREVFLRQYAWIIQRIWNDTKDYIELIRQAEKGDGLYEDLEFLTVCANDWTAKHSVSYPKGYPRLLRSYKEMASAPRP